MKREARSRVVRGSEERGGEWMCIGRCDVLREVWRGGSGWEEANGRTGTLAVRAGQVCAG